MDGDGALLCHAKGFEEDLLHVEIGISYNPIALQTDPIEDLFRALVLGVRDYFHKLELKKACFGLSGGIDSSVVAVIAKEALGKENVLALTLPSRFTSNESFTDALSLTQNLEIDYEEISIEKPFKSFLEVLAPFFVEKRA